MRVRNRWNGVKNVVMVESAHFPKLSYYKHMATKAGCKILSHIWFEKISSYMGICLYEFILALYRSFRYARNNLWRDEKQVLK